MGTAFKQVGPIPRQQKNKEEVEVRNRGAGQCPSYNPQVVQY